MVVEVEEIVDGESLKAYLEEQPVEVAQAIAIHAALMVLPALNSAYAHPIVDAGLAQNLAFSSFCVIQASWATLQWPTHDTRSHVYVYSKSAQYIANLAFESGRSAQNLPTADYTAASALHSAFSAVNSAATAGYIINAAKGANVIAATSFSNSAKTSGIIEPWSGMRRFLVNLDTGVEDVDVTALRWWMPPTVEKKWDDLRARLLAHDPNWAYWINWYEARIRGEPAKDEALHICVAQIEESDWELGAKHVNAMIAGFVEEYALEKTKLGEVLEADAQTGLLQVTPLASRNEAYVETCVQTVEAAVKRMLVSGSSNQYSAILDTLEVLAEDIELDRGNAFSLFNAFSFAYRRIQSAVDDDWVPPPASDARLARLIDALDKGITDLSGSEFVQKGLANRLEFVAKGAPHLVTEEVIEYAHAAAEISQGALKAELVSDTTPKDAAENEAERAAREVRVFGRLLRIRRILRGMDSDKLVALLSRYEGIAEKVIEKMGKLKKLSESISWIFKFWGCPRYLV